MEGPEIRATEILKRINGIEKPYGAEIGVATGQTSQALLAKHKTLRLAMVDSWAGEDTQPQAYKDSGDWHAHCTESEQLAHMNEAVRCTEFAGERRFIIRATSLEASKAFPEATMDFVFIDADHSYEGCSEDIRIWMPKVRKGGWLCGHDYGHTPTEKPWTTGPKKAVDEAVSKFGWKLELGDNYTWFVKL